MPFGQGGAGGTPSARWWCGAQNLEAPQVCILMVLCDISACRAVRAMLTDRVIRAGASSS